MINIRFGATFLLLSLLSSTTACGPGHDVVIGTGDGGATTESEDSTPAPKQGSGSATGSKGSTSPSVSAREACETYMDWSQFSSTACRGCLKLHCSSQANAFIDAESSCERQYASADACKTCNCWDNAITNKTVCRPPWDGFIKCAVESCVAPCK